MIFVAVGTQKFQLNRLLKKIDELIETNIIKETVFAQIGNSDYKPKNYEFTRFLDKKSFNEYIRKSKTVITHSGVGTIISAINNGKPVIVFPRLAKFGEHVDDHQMDIAMSFSKQELILMCTENDKLEDLLKKSETFKFKKYISQRVNVINTIRNYLDSI